MFICKHKNGEFWHFPIFISSNTFTDSDSPFTYVYVGPFKLTALITVRARILNLNNVVANVKNVLACSKPYAGLPDQTFCNFNTSESVDWPVSFDQTFLKLCNVRSGIFTSEVWIEAFTGYQILKCSVG